MVRESARQVGPPLFYSLLIITCSFLPVFALEAQEGRLFKPLAFTKNFSMIIAAVLAVTLDPAMRLLFTQMDPYVFRPRFLCRMVNAVLVGKIHSEESHPISRPLMRLYHPLVELVLKRRWWVVAAAFVTVKRIVLVPPTSIAAGANDFARFIRAPTVRVSLPPVVAVGVWSEMMPVTVLV